MTGNTNKKSKNKFLMLLKNDFLASSRVISLFYIIEVVALAVFSISYKLNKDKVYAISGVAVLGVAVLLIFVSFFFVIWDFNRALYSQQGYLSYSLPVTGNQMLGSKMIVYGGWMIVSYIVFVFIVVYMSTLIDRTYGEQIDMATSLMGLFGLPSKEMIIGYSAYILGYFFVTTLSLVAMVYFAITLSHIRVFQKHSVINAVLIFAANLIVFAVCVALLEKAVDFNLIVAMDGADKGALYLEFGEPTVDGMNCTLVPLIYLILQGVALFFGTSYIMSKKINVK